MTDPDLSAKMRALAQRPRKRGMGKRAESILTPEVVARKDIKALSQLVHADRGTPPTSAERKAVEKLIHASWDKALEATTPRLLGIYEAMVERLEQNVHKLSPMFLLQNMQQIRDLTSKSPTATVHTRTEVVLVEKSTAIDRLFGSIDALKSANIADPIPAPPPAPQNPPEGRE